jgi:excisionase family DNA binding protein
LDAETEMLRRDNDAPTCRSGAAHLSSNAVFLTPGQFATLAAVSRSLIYRLIAQNRLPSIRLGSAVRIPAAALDEPIRSAVLAK